MALKFQYNKTYLNLLSKELKIRENALPTLVAKESALRLEVKKAREQVAQIERELAQNNAQNAQTYRLWREMPQDLVTVKNVGIETKKIAGVKTPVLDKVNFEVAQYSLFNQSAWVPQGIEIIKSIAELKIKLQLARQKTTMLEYARKKTTQKVNLYEKVQIPEYKEGIRKIKRFMEDEENLSKSSQKILKTRMAAAEVGA